MEDKSSKSRAKRIVNIGTSVSRSNMLLFCGLFAATGNLRSKIQIRLTVKMQPGNELMLRRLAKDIGGSVNGPYSYEQKDGRPGHARKPVIWSMSGDALRSALPAILKYMPECAQNESLLLFIKHWQDQGKDFKTKDGRYLEVVDDK